MNLLEITGPQFIAIYALTEVIAIPAALLGRQLVLMHQKKDVEACELTGYDIAYLNGGSKHAFLTAVAALTERGCLKNIEVNSELLARSDGTAPVGCDLEIAIYRATSTLGSSIRTVKSRAEEELGLIRSKLQGAGLVPDELQDFVTRMVGAAILASPAFFLGVPKFMMGLQHHKPVTFLTYLLGFSALTVFWALCKQPIRTQAGEDELRRHKSENASLETNMLFPVGLTDRDMLMAYALFGGTMTTSLDPFNTAKRALSGNNTSYSSGGCGSGSSCGGGCGGGCGGCGG